MRQRVGQLLPQVIVPRHDSVDTMHHFMPEHLHLGMFWQPAVDGHKMLVMVTVPDAPMALYRWHLGLYPHIVPRPRDGKAAGNLHPASFYKQYTPSIPKPTSQLQCGNLGAKMQIGVKNPLYNFRAANPQG